jgi:signal transduction histidine kinase
VSNAARHAHASTVSIRIACENDRLAVRITDDGDGFDQGALNPRRGFGLQSMAQRAESLGGRLHLESEPGSGTMIEVAI